VKASEANIGAFIGELPQTGSANRRVNTISPNWKSG